MCKDYTSKYAYCASPSFLSRAEGARMGGGEIKEDLKGHAGDETSPLKHNNHS